MLDSSLEVDFSRLASMQAGGAAELSVLSRSHDNATWVVQFTYDSAPQVSTCMLVHAGGNPTCSFARACWHGHADSRHTHAAGRYTHQSQTACCTHHAAHGIPLPFTACPRLPGCPQAFFVYKRPGGSTHALFESRPELKKYQLARMHPGAWKWAISPPGSPTSLMLLQQHMRSPHLTPHPLLSLLLLACKPAL